MASSTLVAKDIEEGIAALAAKAKDNTLGMEEMAGGTFTISNGEALAAHRSLLNATQAEAVPPLSPFLASGSIRVRYPRVSSKTGPLSCFSLANAR